MAGSDKYDKTYTDIWNDADFRALPPNAQHLYFVLKTHPTMTACGVVDWRPARIAMMSADWTPAAVYAAATILADRLFIVIDEHSEEALLRSRIKHDGALKVPNSSVAVCTAMAAVASATLRGVIVFELRKLRNNFPDLAGWEGRNSKPKLDAALRQEAVDPADFPTGFPRGGDRISPQLDGFEGLDEPASNPSVNPSANPSINPSETPENKGSVNPSVKGSVKGSVTPLPIPKPKPNTSNEVLKREGAKKTRASRLPEGWMPDPELIAKMRAECPTVDLESEHRFFTDHYVGTGKTMTDWAATWRNWMRRSVKFSAERNAPRQTARERQFAEAEADYRAAAARTDDDPLALLDPYGPGDGQLSLGAGAA